MIVLDAYAVLAYLRDERAAEAVGDLLGAPTQLTAVNAIEVLDQLVRVYGRDADDVHADLIMLVHTGMELGPVSAEVGLLAGRLRARHYHRERMAVSLADCVAAAAALSTGSPLATADPPLARLTRAEGGEIHALPDSAGRLP
ncbi:MAG: PIN domain-containing protein [Solirubrobacteraceae bacterium]